MVKAIPVMKGRKRVATLIDRMLVKGERWQGRRPPELVR